MLEIGNMVKTKDIPMALDRKHEAPGEVIGIEENSFRPYLVKFDDGEFWFDEYEIDKL